MNFSILNYNTFPKCLDICNKNTDDAILLSLFVEFNNHNYGSEFALSADEINQLIGLSYEKSRRCYKRLYNLGFVVKRVKKLDNGVPVNHYQVDAENLNNAFKKFRV